MKCANATCDRRIITRGNGKQRFCSRMCAVRQDGYALQRVRIPMWLYHRIEREADSVGMTFDDAIRFALASEFD